jgi:4Fe-4S single cluster domain of Ferredoxin I
MTNMDRKLQQQITFYLTARRGETTLQPMDGRYRPALMARHGDLSALRYDFPLILNREETPDRAVLSLSRLVDAAVEGLADCLDRDRIARHGYRIERELRLELTSGGAGDFATRWDAAVTRLADGGDATVRDSGRRLWERLRATGDLVDADPHLPARVVLHAWNVIGSGKARSFRLRIERLLLKLHSILAAEAAGSATGRTPERLKAGIGSSFAASFDFNALSRILVEAKPSAALSDERRARIRGLIDVLERQRFYPSGVAGHEHYAFAFSRCSDALKAYQERHEEAVELIRALAVAELEAGGDYRSAVHDPLFEGFGANGLDARQLAELPDYLVCTNSHSLDAAELARLVELLAAGVPIKVLVQTDDVLEPSVVAEGHVAFGLRARQLVDTAIGLADVYVFQAGASHLFRMRDALLRGLAYEGPTLLSVFSGATGHAGDVPPYLVAAAAMESRVFPALVYDPSAGADWASRLHVEDNPSADDDWPVHPFAYEDERLQSHVERLAFTPSDFMAMDERFFRHFAIVPRADWNDDMVSVPEILRADRKGIPKQSPSIVLVDKDGELHRAILDDRTLLETRRCRTMWRSLQELGGIHNSHAQRTLAEQRAAPAAVPAPLVATPAPAAAPATSAPHAPPVAAENRGDDPYIESARCTTCNECTHINSRMFAYNENKQAYIADPDAGTYRQLVEAAEGCQVSVIHPGKPRNPKEPGLEDLIKRAAAFQ